MSRGAPARLLAVAALAAMFLAIGTSPAPASVTIGQVAPGANPSENCTIPSDFVQLGAASGNQYVVPATGTITSWSHNPGFSSGRRLTMMIFRKFADPDVYTLVGHDGPRSLTPGPLNIFPTSIPVRSGDILGISHFENTTACNFNTGDPGDVIAAGGPGLLDGQSDVFTRFPGYRLNVSAALDPTNIFTLGRLTRNARKGTATLEATVPNPGDMQVRGKGVKTAGSGGAVTSKAVNAGAVKVVIRAKGKKKRTLNSTGKVTLKPKITYTPTGGDPSIQSRKVKLKKR